MMGTRIGQTLTVYNKPFLINEILASIYPETISPKVFDEMVEESRIYDLNTILTAMTRQTDVSGLVPNLAGIYDDPQDVFDVLVNFGHVQLLKIAQLDCEIQKEVFDTLKGNHDTTLRALLVLDECQREVIHELMQVRYESPLALAMRRASEECLKELYHSPPSLTSAVFDRIVRFSERKVLYQGVPAICYPKRIRGGGVVEVWQYFFMPKTGEIRLAEPFHSYTVERILENITPKVYKRKYAEDTEFNPRSPSGFIGLLGKVGGALPRYLARQIKKDEQSREKVIREREIAEVLFDIFSR